MKNDKCLICFDLDGVLIQSMQAANQIFFDIVKEDLNLNTEKWRRSREIMALSAEERFDLLWSKEISEKKITETQIVKTLDRFRKKKLLTEMPVLPNAIEIVKLMANNFKNIAAVSSNKEYLIAQTLEKLGIRDLFVKITGIDNITSSKPNPEIYKNTVDYFEINPRNALTIEDSSHGITSASGAGMRIIGVATGLESAEELQKTEADIVLNDLSELTLDMVCDLLAVSD